MSGQALGTWIITLVVHSTTRAAILSNRRRSVSNCAARQDGRAGRACWDALFSKAAAWRPLVPGRTSSASSHTSHTLRINDRRAEWQVSWGFWSGPVDWPGAETAKNRSPEANSLRAS